MKNCKPVFFSLKKSPTMRIFYGHPSPVIFCICLMLLLFFFFPFLWTTPPIVDRTIPFFSEPPPPPPTPRPRHSSLHTAALRRQTTPQEQSRLWAPLAEQGWEPVHAPTSSSSSFSRKYYIQVFLNGGLNQQRMGICDAVAVAKILNATLVIPHFEVNRVWQDSSSFSDIFDVDHFIRTLQDDVSVVKKLPTEYSWNTTNRPDRIKTAPSHASVEWYLENVLPVLKTHGVATITPFTHRLGFDSVSLDIQRIRCKVNYHALKFVPRVRQLGDALVNRLRRRVGAGTGKFVALHLRFDKDMAAHSSCDFSGGEDEILELSQYRQDIWQGRVLKSQFTDEELRKQGRCPLTPEESGLFLAALGFHNTTHLYLATHKVYGGEDRISPLRKLFPLMEDKYSLTTAEERAQLEGKASLMAAVDYYVSMQSDIFISTSPSNMHNALVGYRTYRNLKTIKPNMALLNQLFAMNRKSLGWADFRQEIHRGHNIQCTVCSAPMNSSLTNLCISPEFRFRFQGLLRLGTVFDALSHNSFDGLVCFCSIKSTMTLPHKKFYL